MNKLFGIVLVMVSVVLFTSCEESLDDILNTQPELTFKAKDGYAVGDVTIKTGEEVKFSWEVVAKDKKLVSFTIRMDSRDLEGFPKEKIDRNEYQDEYTISFDKAGKYKLVFIAEDKSGKTVAKDVVITVEDAVDPTAALSDAVAFEWVRKGGKTATGLDVFGLSWTKNTTKSAVIKKDADKFVKLTSKDWTNITTKEALKEAVDKAADMEKCEDISVEKNATYDIVLATKKGNTYYLIHLTKAELTTGASTTVKISGESKK